MLEVKDATIAIGETTLATGLSFTAKDGQLTCITGPEGSGKSTLLRTLMGFLPVKEGFVTVDGELLTVRSAHAFRRMMAYLPQQIQLLRHQLTAPEAPQCEAETYAVWGGADDLSKPQEVVAAPLTPEEIVRLAEEMLQVDGSKQIVIADEPAAMLPSDLAERMFLLLRQQADAGKTVLIASRHPRLVDYADQVVELR